MQGLLQWFTTPVPRNADVPRSFQQKNNYVKLIIVAVENFKIKIG
jgi:hypothetical protein